MAKKQSPDTKKNVLHLPKHNKFTIYGLYITMTRGNPHNDVTFAFAWKLNLPIKGFPN